MHSLHLYVAYTYSSHSCNAFMHSSSSCIPCIPYTCMHSSHSRISRVLLACIPHARVLLVCIPCILVSLAWISHTRLLLASIHYTRALIACLWVLVAISPKMTLLLHYSAILEFSPHICTAGPATYFAKFLQPALNESLHRHSPLPSYSGRTRVKLPVARQRFKRHRKLLAPSRLSDSSCC